MKEQFKQMGGNIKVMKTKGRMQRPKPNTMQTIQLNQVLLLIQQFSVITAMKTAFLQRQYIKIAIVSFQS